MKMGDAQDHILRYWLKACPSKNGLYPSRQDIKISDLRNRMTKVAILDVETDPLDFRYRLIGTRLCDFLHRDYTGYALSELEGKGPGSEIWSILEQVKTSGSPLYRTVPYVGPKATFKQASTLYLPLASDHNTIDKIMLVSHFQRIEYHFQPLTTNLMDSRIYSIPAT